MRDRIYRDGKLLKLSHTFNWNLFKDLEESCILVSIVFISISTSKLKKNS